MNNKIIDIINWLIFSLLVSYSVIVFDFYFSKIFENNIFVVVFYFAPFLIPAFFLTLLLVFLKSYKHSKIIIVNLILFLFIIAYNIYFVDAAKDGGLF